MTSTLRRDMHSLSLISPFIDIYRFKFQQYGDGYPGPHCGETVTITANGKTATAVIEDEVRLLHILDFYQHIPARLLTTFFTQLLI